MKRSKVFLGLTTCILAVAALVASKSSRFTKKLEGYYANPIGQCTLTCGGVLYFTATHGDKAVCAAHNHAPLYLYNSTLCVNLLYTKAGLN